MSNEELNSKALSERADEETDDDRFKNPHRSIAGKIAWKRHRSNYMRGVRKRERSELNQSFYSVSKDLEEAMNESLEDPIKDIIKEQLSRLENNKLLYNVWKSTLILAADNPIKYNKWIRQNYNISSDIFVNAVVELFYVDNGFNIPKQDVRDSATIVNTYNQNLDKYSDLNESKVIKDDEFKLNYEIEFDNVAGGIALNISEDKDISVSTIITESGKANYRLPQEHDSEFYKNLYNELNEEIESLVDNFDKEIKQIFTRHGLKQTS